MTHLCVVQECPVYADIGPYISLLATDAKATIDSIFRGAAGTKILNRYGKHSQPQLCDATPEQRIEWGILGTPNAAGFSTHELFSDGVAYPYIPRGEKLEWWMQGFDVNDADVDRVKLQAAEHGWELWQPYPGSDENHHLNFKSKPSPGPRTIDRIYSLRHSLPRS
jgi:hypothetical protein